MDARTFYIISDLINIIAGMVASVFGIILWNKMTPGLRTIAVLVVAGEVFDLWALSLIITNTNASRSLLAISAFAHLMLISIAVFQMGKDVYLSYVKTMLLVVLVVVPIAFCGITYFAPEWLRSDYMSIALYSLVVVIVGNAMVEYFRQNALYPSLSEYWVYLGLFVYYLGVVFLLAVGLILPPSTPTTTTVALYWLPHAMLSVIMNTFLSRSFFLESKTWKTQQLSQPLS